MIKLLPTNERENAICACCGETRSVKYLVGLYDPETGEKTDKVKMCNRCVAELGISNTSCEVSGVEAATTNV